MSLPDLTSLPVKHPLIALAVVGALTYMLRTWIEAIIKQFFRPFRWLGKKFYWWIAPRNPFSISIRKYKQHISRSNLAFLENPVGPSLKVPLEQSFAPLKLISSDLKREIDLFSYVAQSNRFILLGGPGTGKTTLMKSLLQSVIHKKCASEPFLNGYIPVFIVLRNLAAKSHTVEQATVFAFGEHYFPGAEKYVESALAEGRLMVILDGLDEVGPNRKFVVQQIQEFCEHDDQRKNKNKVVVTCRENSYRTRDLRSVISEVVRVEPFGNDHMRIFLQGWPSYKGKYALSLFSQIQDDSQIKDVCRNPLLLTILTGLFLDAEKFELPTSRDSFYTAALDELMQQRAARRGIEQQFSVSTKYRLLENAALKRLESAKSGEDPEEFNSEVLKSACMNFFGDKANPNLLLSELIEINGILKASGDEVYTFPHRTIQEYLAARECNRSMETADLLAEAAQRPELLEVLHFYCGIIENIPQLNAILQEFTAKSQCLEAARCLANMTETPSTDLIAQICDSLLNIVRDENDSEAALIVLSSLAGRQAAEFQVARTTFNNAVDILMADSKSGTSALGSALATSPELAMKVIPGLLASASPEHRRSALTLLRDIGTDQALDQLVRLLTHHDSAIRADAASVIAGITRTRHEKLVAFAALLPERNEDARIWPLSDYLPSRLALPMIEALIDKEDLVPLPNMALVCGVSSLRNLNGSGRSDPLDYLVSKYWSRIMTDFRLNELRLSISRYFGMCALAIYFAAAIPASYLIYAPLLAKNPRRIGPLGSTLAFTLGILLAYLSVFIAFKKLPEKQRMFLTRVWLGLTRRGQVGDSRDLKKQDIYITLLVCGSMMVLTALFRELEVGRLQLSANGFRLLSASTFGSALFCAGRILLRYSWPKNPLLEAIADVSPATLRKPEILAPEFVWPRRKSAASPLKT
jgi:hypothetical protein